jgi:hypothetical protein
LWQYFMAGNFTSWQWGGKERKRKGLRFHIPFKGKLPVI